MPGLFDREGPPLDGLFLSHAHADHSGLISASRAGVPVWLSEGTSKMVLAGGLFARQPAVPRLRQRKLVPGVPVTVGSFRVTAYPVDHSVYDAMAFLIEADGQRLLYTGDLRFHGRKPGMARQLARIAKAEPLDALLIEGTRLGGRAGESNFSERDLEAQLLNDMKAAPGVVLAMYSPLNVDRFVTFFRTARRAKRIFVIDPYQAFVLHLIGRQVRLPELGATADLRVLVAPRFSFSGAGRRLGHTDWARNLSKGAITADEIAAAPERFVVLFRASMVPWLYPTGLPHGVTAIFSYWPGYLREPRLQPLIDSVKAAGGQFLQRHASGHAHPDDLRRFVEDVRPRLLIAHGADPDLAAGLGISETTFKPGKAFRALFICPLNRVVQLIEKGSNFAAIVAALRNVRDLDADMGILLRVAWSRKRIDVVQHLLELGADCNPKLGLFLADVDDDGTGPFTRLLLAHGHLTTLARLVEACREGMAGLVTILLEAGVNPNAVDSDYENYFACQKTALVEAVLHRKTACVEAMLKGGAIPDFHSPGFAFLDDCDQGEADEEHPKLAWAEMHSDEWREGNKNSCTALMVASALGFEPAVQLLLEHGASAASTDQRGKTAQDYLCLVEDQVLRDRITALLERRNGGGRTGEPFF